ncbi:tandem-95 repeat protein (plasmid) [Leisingera sp. S132]|uniref:Ig-like domain-containing protein n=1 Tax=Leisingera sp. S132 TaxID=2867016 RepID=UPI0021A8FFEA|nr:Ig-like domain-containing protein [Leisingera sp. S132]UWQ81545.1 tandem-95 repeat protein [Leisingera sp. S132]
MVKTVTTDAGAFAVYEAYLRAAEGGSEPLLDLSDAGFYGSSGQGMTAAELQQENIDISAALLAGEQGYGGANPLSVEAVSQIAESLLAQVSQVSGLTAEPNANFTDAELQARADQLSADMLAEFQAQIAANPSVAVVLPSTPEQEAQFNQGVVTAVKDLADARGYFQKLAAGDTSPEVIGLTVAAAVKTATSILAVLPLPPAAKAAVNIVNFATYLAPGIAAAVKGDGDPAALLTIGLQMATSVLTWGASDYFFDYIAPVIVSAAVNAELGANGVIDLSPTAITQGLVEAAVHDNGGTLPDWWYSATGGSGNFDQTYQRAQSIADSYGSLLNPQSYMASLSAQLTAQYASYGNYYQELTLNLDSNLGPQRYYFSQNGGLTYRPFFTASNIILPGVDPNTSNPWDLISVINAPVGINGGLYVLEKDTAAFSASNAADTVFAPAGRPVNLLAGDDTFNFAQDAAGGTGVSPYYQTVTAGLIDGGDGFDTLSTLGLTEGNAAGYTGDIVIDHNTVRYVTGPFYGLDASNFRTIATHRNFEEFHTGSLRLFDMRQSAYAVKLVTENATDGVSQSHIYGSAYGDTLIVDSGRSVTARITLWQGQVTSVSYGDNSSQLIAVDAGAGHDYVAGELVNGASYQGGAGIDTFEILTPDVNRAPEPSVIANTYFVTSLDLETGATWMRTHAVGNSIHSWITTPHYDVLVHTDTTATVQGFEWAVGSQYSDIIYAQNAGSRIRGQAGDDTLHGRDGRDQLYGGDGHDSLLGGGGTDRLQGGNGNDTLDGGAGRDVIMGGSGDDVITDLQGANLISGGAGNDRITTGDAANEIFGSSGNDTITTGNGANTISGGAGNDRIYTGSGNDSVDLGAGVDEVLAGAGDDTVTDTWAPGGLISYYDRLTLQPVYRSATVDGGEGYDVLTLDISGSSMLFTDLAIFRSESFSYDFVTGVSHGALPTSYVNFEEIHLTGGNITVDMVDWLDYEPDFWPSIAGHDLNNAIGTGSGNDNVALGAGNDTYYAGLGNDTIAGESDYDTLDYSRLDAGYTVDFSGLDANGNGSIRILNSDGTLAATDTVSGFEAITGTAHGEAIALDTGDNELRGGGGNDTLRGGAGNDRFLFGSNDGADVLPDAAIGDVLVFEGPDSSAAPSLARTGSAGNYTYTVTFGSTTATFSSPDLLDLNATSASAGGITTWEMTVADGTLVARDDSGAAFNTDEDTVLTTGDVLANDTDPGIANVQIVSFDAVSAHGATVTRVPGTGQFTYDPANIFDGLIDGQFATDTFTYTISDGTTTTTATVTINIAGFTDNPVAYADSATTSEDAPVTIDALANDLDPGAQDAVVSQYDSTGTGGGTVVYNGDGTFTYTPGAGFNSLGAGETGTDTFTYTLDDGRYASTTSVTVTVTGVDDPFTAQDDSRVVLEDQVLTLDVLANDIDPDGDPVSLVSVGTPNVGTAEIVNGQIVYTPPLNYNGPVTFTYDATDGLSTQTATVSLNYVAVDDAPTIVNDTVTATIGRGPVVIDALANDYDPEGGALTIWAANAWSSQGGAVQIVDNQIVWNPASNLGPGTYQLYYGIRDDAGHVTYNGQIDVTLINEQAPYTVNYILTAAEDVPFTFTGTESYFDRNGDTLSVVSVQTENIANATVAQNPDGTYTVTPDANFVGIVYVPVVVTDGLHEVTHTQQIDFRNTYDPITLNGDTYRIRPDELLTVSTVDLLANDVNPDGALNGWVTSVGLGVNGTVTGYTGESQSINYATSSHPGIMTGPSAILLEQWGGRVNFTPDAGFHGIASFQYNFFESAIHAYTAVNGTVTVYVDNDVAAADDTASTAEDTAVIINVLANDSDADGDAMVVHRVDQPANGTAEVLADGTIRYTPDANFSGTETITYYVGSEFQPESAASTATITVTVTLVTDAVTAVDDSVTTAEDQQVVLDLTANDLNPDGLGGAVLSVGTPGHGAIVQSGQTFTYVPDADFNGTDSFSYTREDGLGGTTTATVTVTVTGVNDAPVANADSVTVAEDGSLTFDPRSNDSDPEGTALSITGLGTPAHGSVQINADGTVTYVPDANYFGSDSFTYTVSDGELTATATITVAVQPVQDAPVAVNDSASTAEDTAVVIDVAANDMELDGEALTVTAVTGAANGQVQFSGGRITYTPDADFNGSEQLTYTVSDGNGGTATATVDITVTPVNDAPVVVNDTSSAAQSATQTVAPLANDSDVDGLQLSITALNGTAVQPGQFISLASGALVFLNGDGTVSFFPGGSYDHLALDQSAIETVTYTISDGAGGTSSGTIQFTVTGINDAPVAAPDSAATQEDTAVTVGVLTNDCDAEGNPLTLTAVADPANGTVSFTAGGSITFTPDQNFNGTEVITYTVSDGLGGSSTGTLTVTVAPVNDLPVAADDAVSTNEDTAVTIDVLANDSDAETANLLVTGTTQGANGTVEIVNGQLVYTPDANFHGTDSFIYTVNDRQGGKAEATVTVTVQPVNDAPVAAGDTATTSEDSPVTLAPLANDRDAEGGVLAITALDGTPVTEGGSVTLASGAIVTLNADGTVTFDPNGAYDNLQPGGSPAVVQIPYSIADSGGLADSGVIEITVTGANDPAAFSGQLNAAMSEDGAGTSGRIAVTDPDSLQQMTPGSYTGNYGSLSLAADGSWNYTRTAVLDYLEPGQSVIDSFALTSADGTPAALEITIEGALDHLAITGTAAGESLTGGSGNDTLSGLGGDDTMTGMGGNDIIEGGSGFDYAAYLGNSDEFTFALATDGRGILVTDSNALDGLDEGTDLLLAGTDAIVFADDAVGSIVWQGDQAVSMELRQNGQLISRLGETADGLGRAVTYQDGVVATVTFTDTSADGSAQPWASLTRTLNSSGQVAQSEIVFDNGTTRSVVNNYENGVLATRTLTDGAGSASSARWQSIQRSMDASGNVLQSDIVYDDGTTRSVQNSFTDGIRTGQVLTDGDGAQSGARWQAIARTFDTSGNILSTEVNFDDGTLQMRENTWSGGVLAAQVITDGTGTQSSANWSRLERFFDADGSLARKVINWDDGDRTIALYDAGILTTLTREDLNGDQPFDSRTTVFAPDGSIIDTTFVWDVIG